LAAARRNGKPVWKAPVVLKEGAARVDADPAELRAWLAERCVRTLNVAGNRESKCPGIGVAVRDFLLAVLTG